MKSKLYQDENYLRHLHHELHMLPSEIAKMFDVSQSLIHHYFRKFGIEYDKTLSNLKHRKYNMYCEFLEEYNNPRYDEYKRKSNVYV
jgi:hypothetical protein